MEMLLLVSLVAFVLPYYPVRIRQHQAQELHLMLQILAIHKDGLVVVDIATKKCRKVY